MIKLELNVNPLYFYSFELTKHILHSFPLLPQNDLPDYGWVHIF